MGIFGEWLPGAAYAPNFAPNLKYETAPFPAVDPGVVRRRASSTATRSSSPRARRTRPPRRSSGMYLMTDDPSRAMAIQNASVPQLKSLITDPTLTAVPHFSTFLKIAGHAKTWTNPMISVWAELHDGMDTALDPVLDGRGRPEEGPRRRRHQGPGGPRQERPVAAGYRFVGGPGRRPGPLAVIVGGFSAPRAARARR